MISQTAGILCLVSVLWVIMAQYCNVIAAECLRNNYMMKQNNRPMLYAAITNAAIVFIVEMSNLSISPTIDTWLLVSYCVVLGCATILFALIVYVWRDNVRVVKSIFGMK